MTQALGFAAASLAFVFAGVVLAVGRSRVNRVLAALLLVESAFQAGFAFSGIDRGDAWQSGWVAFSFAAVSLLCAIYPWLLRELDTPITRPLRRRRVLVPLTTSFVVLAVVLASLTLPRTLRGEALSENDPSLLLAFVGFLGVLVLSAFAFVAAVWAYRLAPPAVARDRARSFVLAFGARDSLFLVGIALNFVSDAFGEPARSRMQLASYFISIMGTLLYVPLLAYGILRTQLFDLDLRVKVGIRRSTVVTVMLVVVLAAAKIAEAYLNRTFGFVAGGVAAGAMLVLAPRLNKVGEKVANAAMPQVQPTPAYVTFKKLEVYRAAVESAQETGGIDERQRATLDKLRSKLGLAPDDARAVEAEVSA